MRVDEALELERKAQRRKAREYEQRLREKLLRDLFIQFLRRAAALAREYEERYGDKRLGRIGRPT